MGKFDLRQSVLRPALSMIGSLANATADSLFPKIDSQLAKLFEDRNALLTDGGLITFTGTQVQFTENLKLTLNQNSSGTVPQVISLGAASQDLLSNGDMLVAVINRSSGTATVSVVENGDPLPAVSSTNQEVFLIAKRVDDGSSSPRLYFRNGTTVDAGQSVKLGASGGTGGGGNTGGILGFNTLAVLEQKTALEKASITTSSSAEQLGLNESFMVGTGLVFNLAKNYATTDGTSIYLDHNRIVIDAMDATTGWTASTGSVATSTTSGQQVDGTGLKHSVTGLNGSANISKTFGSTNLSDQNLRVVAHLDTVTNVQRLFVQIESSAGNTVTYHFPVADLIAGLNFLTVKLDTTPNATTGSFVKTSATKIYLGVVTTAAQTLSVTWDHMRTVPSWDILLGMAVPVRNSTTQDLATLRTESTLTPGLYTMESALANSYVMSATTIQNIDLLLNSGAGAFRSGLTGQANKEAWHIQALTLPSMVSASKLHFSYKFQIDQLRVSSAPTSNTIALGSNTDYSGWFKNGGYVWIFNQRYVHASKTTLPYVTSFGANAKRFQLTADATFSSGQITLTHNGNNAGVTDDGTWYCIPECAEIWASAGLPGNDTLIKLTPSVMSSVSQGNSTSTLVSETFTTSNTNGSNIGNWIYSNPFWNGNNFPGYAGVQSNELYFDAGITEITKVFTRSTENYGMGLQDEMLVSYTFKKNAAGFYPAYSVFGVMVCWDGVASTSGPAVDKYFGNSGIGLFIDDNSGDSNRTISYVVVTNNGQEVARVSFGCADNNYYNVKFSLTRTKVQWKVWLASGSEPASYQQSFNFNFTASGIKSGILSNVSTNPGGTTYQWMDNINITKTSPNVVWYLSGSQNLSGNVLRLISATKLTRQDPNTQNPIIISRDMAVE